VENGIHPKKLLLLISVLLLPNLAMAAAPDCKGKNKSLPECQGNPALTIVNTANPTTYSAVGNVISYSFLVTNTGDVVINNLSVADDMATDESCPLTTLAPTESTTCTASYTIIQADLDAGSVSNTASANGTPAQGSLTPPSDTATVTAITSALSPAIVESVTVDWFNLVFIIRGSGFTGATEFSLGGNPTLLSPIPGSFTDSYAELPFNGAIASEVLSQGNYNLIVDGAVALTIYIEYPIIDPAVNGCPCQGNWESELAAYWGTPETACVEVVGLETNDIADISGTVLPDPLVPETYPHYPIGASFYPGEPAESYCALVAVDNDLSITELVNLPINELQQANCAKLIRDNVCDSVTEIP
jgi:uncharacterized repeat protein (TIGR01451 family)